MLYASRLIHLISLCLCAVPLIVALCIFPGSSLFHFSLGFLAVGFFIIISEFHRSRLVTYLFGGSFILISGFLILCELANHQLGWVMLIGGAGVILFILANAAGFLYTHGRIPKDINLIEAFGL